MIRGCKLIACVISHTFCCRCIGKFSCQLISYNMQFEPSVIFKSMDITINTQDVEFLERIVEYMKLLQSLCKIKVLFLVNIKLYLTDEQMILLYREAEYINLQLVLIEHIMKSTIFEEKVVVIDKDDCIINL